MGLTQNQTAALIRADERTIMNIETYRANTTMEILYPLIRTLLIDASDIINPEMRKEALHIINSEYRLTIAVKKLRPWFRSAKLSFLGFDLKTASKSKEKSLLPLIGKQALRISSGLFTYNHF